MATPEEFEREMITVSVKVKENADKILRKVFTTIAREVISETPADVGTAVSNWIASVDAPASGTREAFVPGKDGSTKASNVAEAIAEAEAIAATYREGNRALHLTNNLRYIGLLNGGSSKQAPALFVQAAVAKGVEEVIASKLLD